jgi:phospholipid/cholesterol/gamma-HCH transport system ATP-binding protein
MTETASTTNVTAPTNVVLAAEHVRKSFAATPVLSDVSFVVRRGETVVIIGPSGCGKSTLLRILAGLYRPDAGRVLLFGEDLAQLSPEGLDAVRKRCGLVFQFGALYNSLTVGENIALSLREHTELANEVITIMVDLKLQLVGLQGIQQLLPGQLSGGMQKRVGLARALALDPELLFYDEPTAGLDPVMAGVIDRLITDLRRALGVTSVVVTHDMRSAFALADRILMLHRGEVVAEGTPQEMRTSEHPVVKQFISGAPEGPIHVDDAITVP